MVRLALLLALACVAMRHAPAQATATPAGWRWVTDRPATAVASPDSIAGGDRFWFAAMPPGFHLTMGPGGVLYHPDVRAAGRFEVESEVFLFPGAASVEYGIVLGGRGFDGTPEWVGFLLRGDGTAAVVQRQGGSDRIVRAWQGASGVVPGRREGTARNVLRVVAADTLVTLLDNGAEAARVPRRGLPVDGVVGWRAGSGANLHVTSFDVTRRLAPARP